MASADIEFIKEGGKLAMYLQSGKFKHDRWFWLEGDHLSWDKKKKAPGKANKSEPLAGAKDAPAIKSAQEWFKMIDADGSGAIDEEEFATLYKKARGEKLKKKELKAAMAAMDTDGSGEIELSEFESWWSSNGGDLEVKRHLALTVYAGDVELLLVAPDRATKARWIAGINGRLLELDDELRALGLLPAEKSPEPEEPTTKKASVKQLTRPQCRDMVRLQLQIDELDPNVSDSWIDALFDEFDADGSNTIDDSEWDLLVNKLRQNGSPLEMTKPEPYSTAATAGDDVKSVEAAKVNAIGDRIRALKKDKAAKDVIMAAVEELKAAKADYEQEVGEPFSFPAPVTDKQKQPKQQKKKQPKQQQKQKPKQPKEQPKQQPKEQSAASAPAGYMPWAIRIEPQAHPGEETPLLAPFIYTMHHFTKTGSGQT